MKKFKVKWYVGNLPYDLPTEEEFCKEVMKEIEVEAEDIDHTNYMSVLPEILRKAPYVRGIMYNDTNRMYDYGSHVNFIWVEEITNV